MTLSKIEKMKAIHNDGDPPCLGQADVVTLSKIEKMKAIHNHYQPINNIISDVVTLSKIEKMKAIHNCCSFWSAVVACSLAFFRFAYPCWRILKDPSFSMALI